MSDFHDDMTLKEARDLLRKLVDEGHKCPCCTQFAKVYRRKLNAGIAVALITVFREVGPMGWFHKPTVLSGLGAAARDESIARYWGLLEEERIVRPDGGRSGWWRLTARGALFVNGEIGLDKYVHIYDGRALRFSGATVGIKQCLGEKFDYAELMYGKGEQ